MAVADIYKRWEVAELPSNEKLRSEVIEEYGFDTPRNENLSTFVQSLANSLATITRCKIVCLSVVKGDKQFFYANHGLKTNSTPRSQSFCAHAINKPKEPLIVLNAREDDRFAENPLVLGDPNISFYHGVPLVNMEGAALGALCSINDKPSKLEPKQEAALNMMAKMCVCQLELVRIFRLAKYDDAGNLEKRAKTVKHIRNVLGKNIAFLPSTNARLDAHIGRSGNLYDDFERLLRDENGSMMMFFQLGKEQNLEQLMFWQLAEVYREMPCVEYLVGAVDAFMLTNSQYEVNLNEEYKKQILDVYDRIVYLLKQDVLTAEMEAEIDALCTPDLLDKLQLDMFDLLYDNTFQRLAASPAYEEYLNPTLKGSHSFLNSISMLSPWGKKGNKSGRSSPNPFKSSPEALPVTKSLAYIGTKTIPKEKEINEIRRHSAASSNIETLPTERVKSRTRTAGDKKRRQSEVISDCKTGQSMGSLLDVEKHSDGKLTPLLQPINSLRTMMRQCSTGVTTE